VDEEEDFAEMKTASKEKAKQHQVNLYDSKKETMEHIKQQDFKYNTEKCVPKPKF